MVCIKYNALWVVRVAVEGAGAHSVKNHAIGASESSTTLAVARARKVSTATCAKRSGRLKACAAIQLNATVNVEVRTRTSGSLIASYAASRAPCHIPRTRP
jgi:hypothetical protein